MFRGIACSLSDAIHIVPTAVDVAFLGEIQRGRQAGDTR